MSQQVIDPDVQGLSNIIQTVITSSAVAGTLHQMVEIRMQIYALQEELKALETNLPACIQTAITTPPESAHADSV